MTWDIDATLSLCGHTVDIEQPTTGLDSLGGRTTTWSTVLTGIKAWVQDASAETKEEYARRDLNVTHRIYVQQDPGLKDGWRVKYGTRYFRVVGVRNAGGLSVLYIIDASE